MPLQIFFRLLPIFLCTDDLMRLQSVRRRQTNIFVAHTRMNASQIPREYNRLRNIAKFFAIFRARFRATFYRFIRIGRNAFTQRTQHAFHGFCRAFQRRLTHVSAFRSVDGKRKRFRAIFQRNQPPRNFVFSRFLCAGTEVYGAAPLRQNKRFSAVFQQRLAGVFRLFFIVVTRVYGILVSVAIQSISRASVLIR